MESVDFGQWDNVVFRWLHGINWKGCHTLENFDMFLLLTDDIFK
jgi:hypothetical protein